MTNEIKTEISRLEGEHNIKILYAVESGSRAWGFESADSDWDVRYIYVHNYDWYLSIDDKRDSLEVILPNDIDLAGWELRKALLLFRKSNPPLLEWLRSPIIYKEEYSTAQRLRELNDQYFNPKSCIYHYIHMAGRNYTAYFKPGEDAARIKKYFYVLRPLMACSWIERNSTSIPMEFEHLLEAEPMSPELRKEIDALLEKKRLGGELGVEKRMPLIDNYIEQRLDYYKNFLQEFRFENKTSLEQLNTLFRDTLKEVWA